jgi:hypothetical protein
MDFQMFLPVLVSCFHREAKVVRKAGLECLAVILECYAGAATSKSASIFAQGKFCGVYFNV